MEQEKHIFHTSTVWTGDSDGDGVMRSDQISFEYGRPAQLGGKPGRTNPEMLLTQSVAACYAITFAILLERKRLPVMRFEVEAEGEIVRQPDKTLKYAAIRLKPIIDLNGADEATVKSVLDAAHRTEKYCLISNALRGNVEISVDPQINCG